MMNVLYISGLFCTEDNNKNNGQMQDILNFRRVTQKS